MRNWSHLPPIELLPAPLAREFDTRHDRTLRNRTLNFEAGREADVGNASPALTRISR